MRKIDLKTDTKPQIGYVYFIINNTEEKLYVGETTNLKRIEGYENIYKKNGKVNTKIYNQKLVSDLKDEYNEFDFIYFETINYKRFEKIYLHYLNKNNYDLYNDIMYKVNYLDNEIDNNIIENLNIEPCGFIKQCRDFFKENSDLDIMYISEDIWIDRNLCIKDGL